MIVQAFLKGFSMQYKVRMINYYSGYSLAEIFRTSDPGYTMKGFVFDETDSIEKKAILAECQDWVDCFTRYGTC